MSLQDGSNPAVPISGVVALTPLSPIPWEASDLAVTVRWNSADLADPWLTRLSLPPWGGSDPAVPVPQDPEQRLWEAEHRERALHGRLACLEEQNRQLLGQLAESQSQEGGCPSAFGVPWCHRVSLWSGRLGVGLNLFFWSLECCSPFCHLGDLS